MKGAPTGRQALDLLKLYSPTRLSVLDGKDRQVAAVLTPFARIDDLPNWPDGIDDLRARGILL